MSTSIKVRARTIVEDLAQAGQEDPALPTLGSELVDRETLVAVILATCSRVVATRAGRQPQLIL